MTVSDACEIQLWPIGEDSFNQEVAGWTEPNCFSQKFLCTGTRRLQVLGDETENQELRLSILENGVEIETVDFVQTNDGIPAIPEAPITLPSVEDTYNVGSGEDWDSGVNPSIVMTEEDGPQSKIRAMDYDFIEGNEYEITVSVVYENASSSGNIILYILNEANNIVETEVYPYTFIDTTGTITFPINFTAGSGYAKIGVRVESGGFGGYTFIASLDNITGTVTVPETPATYYLNSVSFNPYDLGLCDKTLTFRVYDASESDPEVYLFYSDPVEFVSVWANGSASGRVTIQYKSVYNFASLIYGSGSPYFSIDLEGRFRKDNLVTRQKALELRSSVLTTAASVKNQRKLTIDDVPDYMHKKINLILAHAASGSVIVNGMEISLEEAYEEGSRPESYPMTPAEVLLTEKNFYSHNVI